MDGARVRVVWGSLKENVMLEQRGDEVRKPGKRGGPGGALLEQGNSQADAPRKSSPLRCWS